MGIKYLTVTQESEGIHLRNKKLSTTCDVSRLEQAKMPQGTFRGNSLSGVN
jgi:hypothetical protein